MRFTSTRNDLLNIDFSQALFQGMPIDGGLFVPSKQYNFSNTFDNLNYKDSFLSMAEQLIASFLNEQFTIKQANNIALKAFDFSPELVQMNDQIYILELFHGKSCAFKDFGASFLAASMDELLGNSGKKALILTATSGDTGSAVAQAFLNKKNIEVVILYPSGKVSPLQEKQLTTLGNNIKALEVTGNFDDCQKMVKDSFADCKLRERFNLTSANSINMGRLIPQTFYYIWASKMINSSNFSFVVPSGNFGNLTAGLYAKNWGLNVNNFIAATNINDTVPRYMSSGFYKNKASKMTISNAMDVGSPSNFERLSHLFKNDVNLFRKNIISYSINDVDTKSTIEKIYKQHKYILCPHSAVAYKAAEKYLNRIKNNTDEKLILLSTAHPGKFTEVIEDILSIKPELPQNLKLLSKKTKNSVIIKNKYSDLKDFLLTSY